MSNRKSTALTTGPAELPKGIRAVRGRDGVFRYYHRKTRTRITGTPGTKAFMEACRDAVEGRAVLVLDAPARIVPAERVTIIPPKGTKRVASPGAPARKEPGTFAPVLTPEELRLARNSIWLQLLHKFEQTPEAKELSDSWMGDITRWANFAALRWPTMTAAQASTRTFRGLVMDWRDELAGTEGQVGTAADRMVQALRRLVRYGYDRATLEANHLLDISPVRPFNSNSRVDFVFKWEWINDPKWLAKLGDPEIALALPFACLTGIRREDMCRLRWSDIDREGWLTVTQSKIKNPLFKTVMIPTHALPQLGAILKRIPRRGEHIFTTHDKVGRWGTRPLRGENLNRKWQAVKDGHPQIAGLHWHDARGTCAQLLEDAGCDDKEQASITGHTYKGAAPSLNRYRKIARAAALRAYGKLAAHLKTL